MRPGKFRFAVFIASLFIAGLIFTCFILYADSKYDKEKQGFNKKHQKAQRYAGADSRLRTLGPNDPFPVAYVIDTLLRTRSYKELMHIYSSMDSSHTGSVDERFVSILTDSLYARHKASYAGYDPQVLMEDIVWAEQLTSFGEADAVHDRVFSAISLFWLNKVAGALDALSKTTPDVKFKQSFQQLVSRCIQNDVKPDINVNNLEKSVHYISEKKWFYLWSRFHEGTSKTYKFIAAAISLILLFCFYCAAVVAKQRYSRMKKRSTGQLKQKELS